MTDPAADAPDEDTTAAAPTRLRWVLGAIMAVALLVLAGTAGWLVRGDGSSGTAAPNAVDIGFARDMGTHHTQAITMAGYERDNTSNVQLKVLAFDIETSQQFQLGEMSGWLDSWGVSRNSTAPMSWMGSAHTMHMTGNLMPGMATEAEMNKLQSLHGRALDVLFLQLMIRHHQGGLGMAKYAEAHASKGYIRTLAGQVIAGQSSEIIAMGQLLTKLGGKQLPRPAGS